MEHLPSFLSDPWRVSALVLSVLFLSYSLLDSRGPPKTHTFLPQRGTYVSVCECVSKGMMHGGRRTEEGGTQKGKERVWLDDGEGGWRRRRWRMRRRWRPKEAWTKTVCRGEEEELVMIMRRCSDSFASAPALLCFARLPLTLLRSLPVWQWSSRPLTPFMPYCPRWLLSVRGRNLWHRDRRPLRVRERARVCQRLRACISSLPVHHRIMGWAAHFKHGK